MQSIGSKLFRAPSRSMIQALPIGPRVLTQVRWNFIPMILIMEIVTPGTPRPSSRDIARLRRVFPVSLDINHRRPLKRCAKNFPPKRW